jgi:hypothetical protein
MSVFLLTGVHRLRRLLHWRSRLRHLTPREQGNLLAEARKLNRAGYVVAAVTTARVAVECALKEVAAADPEWRAKSKAGLHQIACFLRKQGKLPTRLFKLLGTFGKQANKIAHGYKASRLYARHIIGKAVRIVAAVKGGAA